MEGSVLVDNIFFSLSSGFPTYLVSSQQHFLHMALLGSAQPMAA